MKDNNLSKKLTLNKQTVANLTDVEMKKLRAGSEITISTTTTTVSDCTNCPSCTILTVGDH
jgi:hypothetical protein